MAICDEMGTHYSRNVSIFNLTGLKIGENDVDFIQDGDNLYLEM